METMKVQLRREVYSSDAWKIIGWMEDGEVTRYLNEYKHISDSIKQVVSRVNLPVLTHLFNNNGSFFIVCMGDAPIGFLRLVPKQAGAEMVIVIGDKEKWGKGLGSGAILQGLKHAFFEWRVSKVIANIKNTNERSINAFKKLGFRYEKELPGGVQYSLSMDQFLNHGILSFASDQDYS